MYFKLQVDRKYNTLYNNLISLINYKNVNIHLSVIKLLK